MKNKFDIDVCFNDVPIKPYEWNKTTFISGIKATRVSTKTISDILSYECSINAKNRTLLLTDLKTSIVVRLSKNNNVVGRSFVRYEDDENICEIASNLKCVNLDYTLSSNKLKYPINSISDKNIKEYLLKSIREDKSEDRSKYLYYLYFNDISNYSKDRLIEIIEKDESYKCEELYKFLIEN